MIAARTRRPQKHRRQYGSQHGSQYGHRTGRQTAAETWRQTTAGRTLWRWLAFAVLMLGLVAGFAAEGFDVTDVRTRLVNDTYVMDAEIDYEFSERALEALDNGVPLTLEVHIQIRSRDGWIWDNSLVDQRLRYRIRYKPLSERYLVSRLPGENGRTYVTREAAVAALGEIKGLQLLDSKRLEPEQAYEVQIRASLDIEELPLPLRPMAYLYPSWKQSSEWTKWPLTP